MHELSRAEVLTWLALFRDTKPDGLAKTSQADLGGRAGVNVGTIKRAIPRLRRRGLLSVVFRGGVRNGPSVYRVHPLVNVTDQGAPAPPAEGAFSAGTRVAACPFP